MKKIIQYGEQSEDGNDVRARTGQICTISYKAFLKDTETLVESNDDLSFIIGDGDVVPGKIKSKKRLKLISSKERLKLL